MALASPPQQIRIMTYNVENLFDTKPDSGKNDQTYLPIAKKRQKAHIQTCNKIQIKKYRQSCLTLNWDDDTLQAKTNAIAATINSLKPAADIVILQEVENLRVLQQLNRQLKNHQYHEILLEGSDQRGIDVAMLSKYPLNKPAKLHRIAFSKKMKRPTREILEAQFKVFGQTVTVFGVHFPSPSNPRHLRIEAMKFLTQVAKQASKSSQLVLAGGDFNVTAQEDSRIYRGIAAKDWQVGHLIGCHLCKGTNYYGRYDSWSFLDNIMQLRQKNSTWSMIPQSIHIPQAAHQVTKKNRPKRFNANSGLGASDHLPVVANVR